MTDNINHPIDSNAIDTVDEDHLNMNINLNDQLNQNLHDNNDDSNDNNNYNPDDNTVNANSNMNKSITENQNENQNNDNQIDIHGSTIIDTPTDLSSIQREVMEVRKQYNDLESLLMKSTTNNNSNLQDFLNSLKKISHNQTILENKLEDTMKNQMNTDIMINNINQRLNTLSTVLNSKNLKKILNDTKFNNNHHLLSNSNNLLSSGTTNNISTTTNNNNIPSSYNNTNNDFNFLSNTDTVSQSKKKRPGRPRKDPSSIKNLVSDGKLISNNTGELSTVKVTLPTGSVQLSKSKRYFVDPLDSKQYSNLSPSPFQTASNTTSSAGLPPISNSSKNIKYEDNDISSDEMSSTSNMNDDEDYNDESSLQKNNSSTATTATSHREYKRKNKKVKIPRRVTKRRRGRPPKTRTVDTVIINSPGTEPLITESNEVKTEINNPETINNNNPITTSTTSANSNGKDAHVSNIPSSPMDIYPPESIDQRSNSENNNTNNNNNNNIHIKKSSNTVEEIPELSEEEIKQQKILDKLRDSREKMLVNMKYNDRDKAKSFMESNKELLLALKEEEKRRRLTANANDQIAVAAAAAASLVNSNIEDSSNKENTTFNSTTNENVDQNRFDESNVDSALLAKDEENNTETPDVEETHDDSMAYTPKKAGILDILNAEEMNKVINNNRNNNIDEANIDTSLQDPNQDQDITKTQVDNSENTSESHYNLRTKRKLVNLEENDDGNIYNDDNSIEHPLRKRKDVSNKESDEDMEEGNEDDHDHDSTDIASIIKSEIPPDIDNNTQNSQSRELVSGPIELICKGGFFYNRNNQDEPITTGSYLDFKFHAKEDELLKLNSVERDGQLGSTFTTGLLNPVSSNKQDRNNAYFLKLNIEQETETAFNVLSKTTLTEKYVNSLEYFLMEFRWENKLVGLGLKLRESKRTWQRRKALFTLFEFWRDQSIEKRNFKNFTILHAIKEMENYRIFINRSVSWFYNHITLLKMILYDLCDNVDTQWREWMFPKDKTLPALGEVDESTGQLLTVDNINAVLDHALTLKVLDDGSENNQVKQSQIIVPKQGNE